MLEIITSLLKPPPHAHVGEAYLLHQSLAAFYYLRAKARLYQAHCQTEELKAWWQKAEDNAFDKYIKQLESLMKELGIPLPPTVPEFTDLSDQFMALDGAAMVKGMLEAHTRGLHAARRPDIAILYHQMMDGALFAGAQLAPLMEREGWMGYPPAYPSAPGK